MFTVISSHIRVRNVGKKNRAQQTYFADNYSVILQKLFIILFLERSSTLQL